MEKQAAPLQCLRKLAGVVGREEHQRDLVGTDRAELGDRYLIVREYLEE